jgi:hypothetical protein
LIAVAALILVFAVPYLVDKRLRLFVKLVLPPLQLAATFRSLVILSPPSDGSENQGSYLSGLNVL